MHSRVLTGGLLALGLSLAPAAASASTTTTTAPKTTTTVHAATPAHDYEVVCHEYVRRSNAVKELDKIRKDGITGMYVAKIGTKTVRYRAQERHLTRAQAISLEGRLHSHHFSASRIRD